jgi:hypothetical protein
MKTETYDHFRMLRFRYYITGRELLSNGQYETGCINLGYSIELSLKFLLAYKGYGLDKLKKHHLKPYYDECLEKKYLTEVEASNDFWRLCEERLNARYPIMIIRNFEKSTIENRGYFIPIDIIHAYDDLLLQLDDQLVNAMSSEQISFGFIALREIESQNGRIFFHSNDHAFMRIPQYLSYIKKNLDQNSNLNEIERILRNPVDSLWNFKGLLQYRPWGPKTDFTPAKDYRFPQVISGLLHVRAAQWQGNPCAAGLYLSTGSFVLGAGEYKFKLNTHIIEKQ